MNENIELKKDFINNLKTVIKFRHETINLIEKVLEKSESKVQNKKDIENLIDRIMNEFSNTISNNNEYNLQLLKNTLKLIFEKQLKFSKMAKKIVLLKKNPPSIFR